VTGLEIALMVWGTVVAPLGAAGALVVGCKLTGRRQADTVPVAVPVATTAASRAASRVADHSETVSLYEAMNLAAAGKL
jgi:hypothetical protein